MKKVNNILKMISNMESNANEVKLAQHKVELANTFNQVVDKHKFLEKTINEHLSQFNGIKKWIQGSKQDVDQNIQDLKRIQVSLKELGFNDESTELSKYLSSNIYKEFDKLYNSTK